ncbi:MAG: hypothetical protein KKF39_02675, partial [Nanoarchaeota archaeon]|nr:hypothetical protein [Nanoarchaeota archaeon]
MTDNEYNKVYLTGLGECYDNETEILTEEGWRYFYELGDEKVATLNSETGELEWETPKDKQVFDHDGEMFEIELEDGSKLVVNERHKVYAKVVSEYDKFRLIPIIRAYELINENKEIYFLDFEGNEVKVKSIGKVSYSGKVYGVDVENDIVLVRRKSEKKLVENYDEDSNRSQILDAQVSDFGWDLGAGFWMNGCRKMDGTEGGGVGG